MPMNEPLSYPDEVWKPVTDPRFAEPLEASDYGRVRRMGHRYLRNGRPGVAPFWSTKAPRIAHVFFQGEYPFVNAKYATGKTMGVAVHILVCCAFHGDRPTPIHEVAHGDGIPPNVTPDNLRWATPKENEADKALHGTRMQGVDCHLAVLDDDKVRQARAEYAVDSSRGRFQELAVKYGVARPTITRAIRRQTWKHVT